MLKTCFNEHTSSLIQLLDPDIIVLSGIVAQKFKKRIQKLAPAATILKIPHYAMRGTEKEKQRKLSTAKTHIAALTAS